MVHFRPSDLLWSISVQFSSIRSIQSTSFTSTNFGPIRSNSFHSIYFIHLGPIWSTLVHFGTIWSTLVHFDTIQSTSIYLVYLSHICPIRYIRSIWSNSVHFDPIRSIRFYSVHVGPIRSILFYSIQLGPLLSIFSNSVNYTNPYLLFIYYNQFFFYDIVTYSHLINKYSLLY